MTLAREAIRLNTTVYGDHTAEPPSGLVQSFTPAMDRTIIQHECPLSIIWPQKDLGPIPPIIAGTIVLYETAVNAFMADVASAVAERKLHWMDLGTESYAWVRSGVVTSVLPWGEGMSAYFRLVSFQFVATRCPIYRTSDDVVMRAGS